MTTPAETNRHLTPSGATQGPAAAASLESRAVIASDGNLDLVAEAFQSNPAEVLDTILRDPHFTATADAALALKRLRLVSELTDHIIDKLEDMSGDAAGRLLTRLMELAAKSPVGTGSSPGSPVLIQNNINQSDPADIGRSARERLAERIASVAIPATAS